MSGGRDKFSPLLGFQQQPALIIPLWEHVCKSIMYLMELKTQVNGRLRRVTPVCSLLEPGCSHSSTTIKAGGGQKSRASRPPSHFSTAFSFIEGENETNPQDMNTANVKCCSISSGSVGHEALQGHFIRQTFTREHR